MDRCYWKVNIKNIKYLPKDKFNKNQIEIYPNYVSICGNIYVSYGEMPSAWMEYCKSSIKWYSINGYKYMGEIKSPNQIRKERLNNLLK